MSDDNTFPDDFPIEFHTAFEDNTQESKLFAEAERRLRALGEGHSDLTGASINITQPAKKRATNYIYEATVVLEIRPNRIAATEKHETATLALKNALDAIERQVHEKREELRNY